jgi:hypothetical protein
MPDHSGTSKLDEGRADFKPKFSIAPWQAIADIALTSGTHRAFSNKEGAGARLDLTLLAMAAQAAGRPVRNV